MEETFVHCNIIFVYRRHPLSESPVSHVGQQQRYGQLPGAHVLTRPRLHTRVQGQW